ncbi:MAG: hypothetical protein GEV08_15805 [Acidimicrobiia bacterium]|nr:hypothetical protein [Acidimicrobiia bacterium]
MELLADSDDFAVVRLPRRRRPAVAVQGDTLDDLARTARQALTETRRGEQERAIDVLEQLVGDLGNLQSWYGLVVNDVGPGRQPDAGR